MHPFSVHDLAVDYTPSDPDALAVADARARSLLGELGCFLARGLFGDAEVEPVRRDVRRLIGLRWRLAGLGPEPPSEPEPRFDDGLMAAPAACGRRRPTSSRGHLSVAVGLAGRGRSPPGRLSRELMSTQTVGHGYFTDNAEVRLPDRDRLPLLWRQDYPYVQDSEDGLTYWVPLHDCGEREGNLRLAPGSHKLGALPVPRSPRGRTARPRLTSGRAGRGGPVPAVQCPAAGGGRAGLQHVVAARRRPQLQRPGPLDPAGPPRQPGAPPGRRPRLARRPSRAGPVAESHPEYVVGRRPGQGTRSPDTPSREFSEGLGLVSGLQGDPGLEGGWMSLA